MAQRHYPCGRLLPITYYFHLSCLPNEGQVAQVANTWLCAGQPGFDPGCQRGGDFSSLLRVQTNPGPTQPPIKMSIGGFPQG